MQTLIRRPVMSLREIDLLMPIHFARTFFLNHKGRLKLPKSPATQPRK